jgi:hypothetical protein
MVNKPDLQALIGDATAALPEELIPVIDGIIHGDIVSLAVVVERQDGVIGDLWVTDMNDGKSNRFAVLGGLENLKHDFMCAEIESRVDYAWDPEGDDSDD